MSNASLMALGGFIFQLTSAPLDQIQRTHQPRYAENQRVGKRPAYQFLGLGEEPMTLSGRLRPEITGGPSYLQVLKDMATSGNAWVLLSGTGADLGLWIITSVKETLSVFHTNGQARSIDFEITLKRIDDDDTARLGNITGGLQGLTVS